MEAYKRATGADRARLDSIMAMGDDRAAEKISSMQQLYIDLGIKADAVTAIEDYHARAMQCLEGKGFSAEQIAQLQEFSATLVHRND